MIDLTAHELREMVSDAIADDIDLHRESRAGIEGSRYERPLGPPTDEEIDDFLVHNPLIDSDTREHLIDPGLLGFFASQARATDQWVADFDEALHTWAATNAWLGADLPWLAVAREPDEHLLWAPAYSPRPSWIDTSPSALLLAADLLRSGRLLEEMNWRSFEELIGQLLEREGWTVEVTKPSRDGGVDVIASKLDDTLGAIRSLWQAKKYKRSNLVRLKEVRELAAVVDFERATKGILVTTSRLTSDAIEWIERDTYRLGYKDGDAVERWIRRAVFGDRHPPAA